ncbi:hypothetical protein AB4407_06620, partial [Vibrio sp. 10N.261.46.E11]|uniref:hypothetical protein n=1 Tax=Vibrio sp. 10N.261.46.E11 TaxID=3229662 RepID=UPI00354C76A0
MNNEKIKKSNEPIFVHSLFRSGSTYVFKKFREKDELYTSYQEPVHEISYLALSDFEILNETVGNKENSVLRHPLLKKSYFAELYDIAGDTLHHLNKEDIYTNYFDNNVNSLCVYLQSIIRNSEHRCVIQECRLTSRISAIKKNIAGMHLYLWRNPWDQWWSYKVTDYFDAANIWILNANNPPNLIERIVKKLNIPKSNEKDLSKALNFYKNKKLNAEDSYFVFYTIWLLSLIEASEQADYLFNIDKLSISDDYKKLVSNELQNRGVQGLDFSDCEIPQAHFANKDIEFFTAIESSVHSLFLKVGYENELLEKVLSLRYEYSPHKLRQDENLSTNQILKDSERARELTRNYMSDLSVLHQKFESEDNNNKYLILQAEQAMHQAIVKARKLEAKVSEAEAKASEAEAK